MARGACGIRALGSSRPFAPNSLRTAAAVYVEAIYLPFWSFSATRSTDYVGQRGTAYKQTASGEREYGEGNNTEWATKTRIGYPRIY